MQLKNKFIIGVAFALVGFMVSVQINASFKITNKNNLFAQTPQELMNDLKNLRDEKQILIEEFNDLNSRIQQYEEPKFSEGFETKTLKKSIAEKELLVGYREGIGPGIVVTIDNLPNYDPLHTEEYASMYSYTELVDLMLGIINVLNIDGAEAISINDQRYISTTGIYTKSNLIEINSAQVKLPLIIKAVGNSDSLEEALNMKFGIIWKAKEYYNLHIDVKKETDIIIPRYGKTIQHKYAKPLNN